MWWYEIAVMDDKSGARIKHLHTCKRQVDFLLRVEIEITEFAKSEILTENEINFHRKER